MNKFNLKKITLIENEVEVNENNLLKSLFKKDKLSGLQTLTHSGLMGINKTLADDLLNIFTNRTSLKSSVGTVDNLIGSLAKGTLKPTQLGDVLVGTMKTPGVSKELVRELTPIWVSDANFIKSHIKDGKLITNKKGLIQKGYSTEGANAILLHFKAAGAAEKAAAKLFNNAKGGKTKLTPKTNGSKVKKNQKKTLFDKSKELLEKIKGKKTWSELVKWAAVFGVGPFALWWAIYELSDLLPDGMPENEPTDTNTGGWLPCIQQMIDSKEGVIKTASNGSQLVSVKNSEYPEGLNFFSNGRVGDVKSKKKGTWKCKGEVVSINEIVGRILRETLLHEQGSEIDINTMTKYVDEAVDDLDGYVAIYNLNSLIKIITNLKGKTFQGKDALSQFLRFYKEDEGGDDFLSDVKSVGVRTLGTKGILAKEQLLSMLEGGGGSTQSTSGFSNIQITWDSPSESESTSEEGKTSGYRDCEGKDFPLEFGCKSSKIAEVQKCLGVTDDGKFGPNTKKALEDNKHDVSKGLTKDVYNLIKNNCGTPVKPPPTNTTTSTPDSVPPNTTTVTGETPTNIQMMPEPDGSVTNKTGEQIFKELMEKGLLKKDMFGRIKLKERNNDKIPIDVPSAEVEKLNVFLKTYKKGYTLGKQKDKSYGDKIVWVKK
jgi:hypothetical protein